MIGGYLLDTCAAIWLANGDPMTEAMRSELESAQSKCRPIWVSAITAWEIGTLAAKGRVLLSMPVETWFQKLISLPGIQLAELSPEVLIRSTALPGSPPNDPADRIIVATARELGAAIVTRDRLILGYARQPYVNAITC